MNSVKELKLEELNDKLYERTLQFIFIKATLDMFKDAKIIIEHSINRGIYGDIHKSTKLSEEDIEAIKKRMQEIIDADLEIKKVKVTREAAINIFSAYGLEDKVMLLKQIELQYVNLYELDGRYDYFYGRMAKSTGHIEAFDFVKHNEGFRLMRPNMIDTTVLPKYVEQKKVRSIFRETSKWSKILGVRHVASLNEKIENGELINLMMTCEALHEKKIGHIADMIGERKEAKLILIAGPSSSGKTTFANRLSIQLRVNGLIPIAISMDDYFVDRVNTPVDENGEYDFESIRSVDTELLNEHLNRIFKGEEVELPQFNFFKGEREWLGKKFKLPENGVVILEGIHGLNPELTSHVEEKYKFRIYVSALTQLNLDNHNRISTTDVRRVRRIVRDALSRGHGAEATLAMWPKIKSGEKKNIFVYQEEADVMFNSTLAYELCVLKEYALRELEKIDKESPVYLEGQRLISFLGFFKSIDKDLVATNSILREFIGGSIFYKY